MALTRVSGQVIKSNTDLTVGVLTATTASFTTVSVAGTITYDDVTNVDSVGLITARSGVNITSGGLIVTGISTVSAGTTSAPSISPSGDSNTGIFFPAADTIAFAEGGAEAARFDSSGRLLVGTSSARANLFNASASAQLQIEGTDGNNSAILIARNSNDTAPPNFHLAKSRGTSVGSNTVVQNNDLIGRITFTGSDGTEFVDAAFIEASVDGTPGANDMPGRLVFSTTADGASSPTERMRLDSSGRLGIGTSSPSRQLSLSDTNPTATFRSTSTTGQCTLFFGDSDSDARGAITYENNGDKLGLWSAGGQKLTIDSSGNVGIGTQSPSGANLVIDTESNSGSGIRLIGKSANDGSEIDFYADNNSTRLGYIEYNNSSTTFNSETNVPVRFFQNGGEAFRVDTSKRLLVGTSSASFSTTVKLQGNSGSSTGESRIRLCRGTASPANGDTLAILGFSDNTETPSAEIAAQRDGGTWSASSVPGRLVFSVTSDGSASPTERARLTSTGEWFVYSSGNDTLVAGNAAGSGTAQSLFTGVHTRTSTTGGGTVAYRIYNNGTTFSVSDARQKKNIETARNGYLEDLQQLRVVKYNWLDQDDSESKELGLIAQEVAEVFPGLVQSADPSDPESTLGIKSSVFSFMLIKALQEAGEKIEALETRLAALEAS